MLAKKDQLNFCKMAIKLFLLFGTSELIGLVQILDAKEKDHSEVIFNMIFGLFFILLRCSRGIFPFILFTMKTMFQTYP